MRTCMILLALGTAPLACSQEGDPVLVAQRRAKLAEPWVARGGWGTDYEAALAESRSSGKPVLAYFTRSYAP